MKRLVLMKHFLFVMALLCSWSGSGAWAQTVRTEYERGTLKKGKPVGVWEYYEAENLALVVNYDSAKVRYVRPDTARSIVWLDSTWQVKRLSITPRLLGSRSAMVRSLQVSLRYPWADLMAGRTGNVVVSCIVYENGQVSKPFVELAPSPSLGEEVRRMVNELPLSYIPGMYRGKIVRTKVQFSVKFCTQTARSNEQTVSAEKACAGVNPAVYGGFGQIIVTSLR